MNFITMKYLAFFAVTVFIFFLMPKKYRWCILLAASLIFYWSANPYYLIYLFIAVLSTYFAALYMGAKNAELEARLKIIKPDKETKKSMRSKAQISKRVACSVALIITLGVLGVLKYYNFVLGNLIEGWTAVDLILPLGISFYTFQAVGYCIDVYRGMCEPQRNILKYTLYVIYFPQILQGPIGSYNDLAPQLWEGAPFDRERISSGILRILWGFFKKLVIADRIAIIVNALFDGYEFYQGFYVAVAAVGYAIQLYGDFSGYMDIALGCSEILGITLTENFSTPYFSGTISEFWRRWHISLGAWFRNYVFYSLERSSFWRTLGKKMSGFSKSLGRSIPTACALFVVWLLIGAWHGASWKYIVYGLYHGGMIILALLFEPVLSWLTQKLKIHKESDGWRRLRVIRTFTLVSLGYIIFRSDNLIQAGAMFKGLFAEFNPGIFFDGALLTLGLNEMNMAVLLIAVFIMLCVDILNQNKIMVRAWVTGREPWFQLFVMVIGFFTVLIFGAYGAGYNAADFIYFKF